MAERALPRPTPETAFFWEGTLAGELRLQRCTACGGHRLPPRPLCPDCGADATEVVVASGRARLHSYVISHLPVPGFEPPHVIALVELEEGPRLVSNLVGVPPEPDALLLDLPLELTIERVADGVALPLFRLAGSGA